ncbi:E3 ubiquitin-protein ligase DZIP3, partial [Stylophora pistillata]
QLFLMACTTPQTSSTKESTNYARLCRLLVDIGNQALRDQFNVIHHPGKLHKVLAKNKSLLEDLKKKKFLYLAQWDKLFPSDPKSVSSETFDISLLAVLFRNICGLTQPSNGWDNLPPESDTSPAADIARVKYYRNTVYAHAERTSVDEADFNQYWSDIRDALVRLGGPKYKAEIDNLETKCMVPEVEDHYKKLFTQWKKDEESVKDQLNELGIELKNVAKQLDVLSKMES